MTTSPEQLRALLIVVALTVVSGIGDAHGFLHAARVWRGGQVIWPELAHSAAGFSFGVAMYWTAVRFYQQLGIGLAETQTIVWFAVTITGVALLNGQFLHWARIDQVTAVVVLAGVGWLLIRTGA